MGGSLSFLSHKQNTKTGGRIIGMVPIVENATANAQVSISLHTVKGYLFWSRLREVILAAAGLVVLSPLMLLTAAAIYLDDPHGSPIFSQMRCGKDGKPFRCYKFRSMCVNAEQMLDNLLDQNEMSGPVFKIRQDPRITRVGRLIRKTSIDELPQLVNVLQGHMSLVGPRPPLLREVEMYDDLQKQRLSVKPGLTCYWQIQPNRNKINFDDWVQMDLRYIHERSLWIDWKIICKTFVFFVSVVV